MTSTALAIAALWQRDSFSPMRRARDRTASELDGFPTKSHHVNLRIAREAELDQMSAARILLQGSRRR